MHKHGITRYTRFHATDGRNLDPAQCKDLSAFGLQRLQLPDRDKIWGMDLTTGALGCALSHFSLWRQIAAMRLEYAIIVEDDTEFSPDFTRRLRMAWRDLPAGWEFGFLSGLDTANTCQHMMVGPRISLVPEMYKTTNLYAITLRGAQKMLEKCVPLHFQLDTQITLGSEPLSTNRLFANMRQTSMKPDTMAVSSPRMYACVPPLAIQRTSFGSDIQFSLPEGFDQQEIARRKQAGWNV